MIDPLAEPSYWLYNAVKPLGPVAALSFISVIYNTARFHMLVGMLWAFVSIFAVGFLMANPLYLVLAVVMALYHAHMFERRLKEQRTVNKCLGGGGVA
jgi:hypothetical protein